MRLVPWESFVIHVPAPPQQVAARLQAEVEPVRHFRSVVGPDDWKPYEGTVDLDRFTIRPIDFGFSLGPVVHGRFVSTTDGTDVLVRTTPSRLVIVSLVCFCAILAGFAVWSILAMVSGDWSDGVFFFLFTLALGLFSWFTGSLGFGMQATRTRRWLENTVNDVHDGRSPG
jgi:hypothetical protein